MKYYAHKVTVSRTFGQASFPIDMLRYDALVPLSQTDSSKIHRCCEHKEALLEDTTFNSRNLTIELWKRDVKTWKPTIERWASFLWKIVGHEVR